MNTPRQDCWGRMVQPNDGTMGEWFDAKLKREAQDHCGLCGEPCPADPEIEAVTGFTVCTRCIEDQLQ